MRQQELFLRLKSFNSINTSNGQFLGIHEFDIFHQSCHPTIQVPKDIFVPLFQLSFQKIRFLRRNETKGARNNKLIPPNFHKVGKPFISSHTYSNLKGLLASSRGNIINKEKNQNIIKCDFRKDNLVNPLKVILSINMEKKSINSVQERNLLMTGPFKLCTFQRRVNQITRVNRSKELIHCRSQSSPRRPLKEEPNRIKVSS